MGVMPIVLRKQRRHSLWLIMALWAISVVVNGARFSFPVGKVDIKTLYPMNVEEFMLALGKETLVEKIRTCFKKDGSF